MTGPELRTIIRLIDQATRQHHATRKWCPRCNRWLDRPTDFYKDGHGHYRGHCRTCTAADGRDRRAA